MTRKDRPLDIGRRLSTARLRRSMSQGTVARRAGLAASYLSRIETGKVQPTFRTVFKIANAMNVPLEEVVTPNALERRDGSGCPVTMHGHCLLDLIRSESEITAGGDAEETYSPRQVRLIRRFAGWLQAAGSDRLRAMEILLDDLSRGRDAAAAGGERSSRRNEAASRRKRPAARGSGRRSRR